MYIESSAVATEASATPGAQTSISTSSSVVQSDTSSLLEVTDTKREQSVESNTSSRGALDDSETK